MSLCILSLSLRAFWEIFPQNTATMIKETQTRAKRLAQRNTLIQLVFNELTIAEKMNYSEAYVFLGKIFGLNDRQIRKILLQKTKVALSAANLAKLSVILHRISAKIPNE